MKKIAYVRHPLSEARKQELMGQGYKILDARFAPSPDDVMTQTVSAPKPAPQVVPEDTAAEKLRVGEIRERLTELGIDFDPAEKKAALLELLKAAETD